MPERSTVFQGLQIGKETTSGTGVAANKILSYLGIEATPELAFATFSPMGQAVAGSIVPSQLSTTASVAGQLSFSEHLYVLNSIYGLVTPTTVDTTAKRWNWVYTGRSAVTPTTYTVEFGDSTFADKFAFGTFNGHEITYRRTEEGLQIGGSMIGQNLSRNITLTVGPTAVEDKPVVNTMVDVWIDPTSGALGTTKQTRVFEAVFRHNDAFGSIWPLNSANASWANVVATRPTVQMEILMEDDTQGNAQYTAATGSNATQFIRIGAISTENAGAASAKYDLLIDMAAKVSGFGGFTDEQGVRCLRYTFDAVYDATWGAAVKIQNTNKVTAL